MKKLDRRRFGFVDNNRRRMIDSSSLLKLTGSLICVCGGNHGSWFVDLRVRFDCLPNFSSVQDIEKNNDR